MKNYDIRLSKESTQMIDDMFCEMRNADVTRVNSAFLLGAVYTTPEKLERNPLGAYFKKFKVDPYEVEDLIFSNLGIPDETDKTDAETVPEFTTIIFENDNGEELNIPITQDVESVFEKLGELQHKFELTEFEPLHFTVAMFMADNRELKDLFKTLSLSYVEAKKYFSSEKMILNSSIPFELSGFLSLFNDRINVEKPCEILMRDKETDSIWNIMLKKNKRNAIIVGEAGVGKTALVEKITYEIQKGICPKEFENFRVISLDVNSLIAGTSYRGDAEERIQSLIDFLKNNDDVILFIDEVHTILGAGSCFEGEMDLANALKPILARGDTIVIGATTGEEYEKYFKKDAALSRRFEKVEVKEPLAKEIYPMIKNKIQSLSEFHGVKINRPMVDYLIMIAHCFAFDKKNPDKTLDLIDRAMVSAKRAKKKWVDKSSILKNFAISFDKWDKMSVDSKKETAYHEAGHYIVSKASKYSIDLNHLAVSIMPAEYYLGITVFEENPNTVAHCDYSYYIDSIATDLAGRVAESVFTNNYTSGASQDLQTATKTAFTLVTQLGMANDSLKNRIFLDAEHYPMFSEKAINETNEAINAVIEAAYQRATNIIDANKDILEAIVEALLENPIMSEDELDKLWKDVVSKRNVIQAINR